MPLPHLVGLPLALLLLSGCSVGDPSTIETTAPSPSTATTTPVNPSTAPTPVSTLPAGVDQLIRVTVRRGDVVGGAQRVRVNKGSVVRLVVTSDVADDVHLHTYDKKVVVAAGGTATLTFTASIPGIIKVELEHAELTLVRFQIQ